MRVYPGAGHDMIAIGDGTALTSSSYNRLVKGFMDLGGTPNGTCKASFNSARDMVDFLDRLPTRRSGLASQYAR